MKQLKIEIEEDEPKFIQLEEVLTGPGHWMATEYEAREEDCVKITGLCDSYQHTLYFVKGCNEEKIMLYRVKKD